MLIGHTPQEVELWKLFEPTAKELGLELVNIHVTSSATPTLEILADVPDAKPGKAPKSRITLDQCATLSRRLGRLLDVEDIFPEKFHLEVSSPGVERPYATVTALEAAMGQTVKAKLAIPMDGHGKLKGVLTAVNEETITIDNTEIALSNIRQIKRVLTEDEMKNLMKGATK